MSREYKNIDELFQSELGSSTSKVPTGIKANIDKQLGFRNRKYLWLGLPLTMALIASLIFIPDWSTDSSESNSTELTANETNLDGNSIKSQTSDNTETNSSESGIEIGVSADQSSSSQTETDVEQSTPASVNTEKNSSPAISTPTSSTETSTTATSSTKTSTTTTSSAKEKGKAPSEQAANGLPSSNQEMNQNGTSTEGIPTDNGEDPVETENKSKTSTTTDTDSDNATTAGNQLSPNNETENLGSDGSETKKIEEKEASVGNEGTRAEEKNESTGNEVVAEKAPLAENETANGIDENQSEDVAKDVAEEKNENEVTEDSQDGVEIEKPKEKRKPWMLTLEGGPNITRSFYDANDVTEQNLYSASMSDRIGTELNFTANYRLRKGFTFGTGLQYSSFKEDYDFVDEYWMNDSTVTFEYIYDDSSGLVIDTLETWTYDSTFVSNFNEQGINKASYLSLPINLGVQIPWGKFRFDILATIRYNFLLNASGLHYDDNSFIAFTHKSNNVYKRGYFDAVFAGNIHYNLFKNFYLTASIRYKPVFGNTYNTNGIDRRFHYTHLGLGFSLEL